MVSTQLKHDEGQLCQAHEPFAEPHFELASSSLHIFLQLLYQGSFLRKIFCWELFRQEQVNLLKDKPKLLFGVGLYGLQLATCTPKDFAHVRSTKPSRGRLRRAIWREQSWLRIYFDLRVQPHHYAVAKGFHNHQAAGHTDVVQILLDASPAHREWALAPFPGKAPHEDVSL